LKRQKEQEIKKAEAQYLRFLRTKERAENFQTIKIIGKGAFGEVRLVQRKNDGKIYALKSLVKSEMVGVSSLSIYLTRPVQKRSACSRPLRA
jgi:protein-serine/threonine kinase